LEEIRTNVSSKRKAAALDNVKAARTIISSKSAKMTASCREPSLCTSLLQTIATGLSPLEVAVKDSQDSFTGSEQERAALDKAYVAQTALVQDLTLLEENMVPAGYEVPVPDDYSDLAQLKGRATVEFVLQKPDGGVFDINGVNFKEAKMVMVIDGYTGT
jgi:peptidylprolyl isomerase